MKKLRVLIILACLTLTAISGRAQEQADRDRIYQIVLRDFVDSVARNTFPRVALPDSTCEAVFYGGFPDSINKKYLGFEEISYFDAEVFRRNFIDFTKKADLLTAESAIDSLLIMVPRADFRKAFTIGKAPGAFVVSDKGFEKLLKMFWCECYCELSRPYFMSPVTALIYFHYQCGVDNEFPNVYIFRKQGADWVVVTKLRTWSFGE